MVSLARSNSATSEVLHRLAHPGSNQVELGVQDGVAAAPRDYGSVGVRRGHGVCEMQDNQLKTEETV